MGCNERLDPEQPGGAGASAASRLVSATRYHLRSPVNGFLDTDNAPMSSGGARRAGESAPSAG